MYAIRSYYESLRFKTSGTLGVDLPPVEDLRSVDPFAFMKGILTVSLTVEHWDGDRNNFV